MNLLGGNLEKSVGVSPSIDKASCRCEAKQGGKIDNLKPVALYDSLIKIRCGLTVLVALVVLMLGVMATGNTARAEDKVKKRFVDNGDGTITDRQSGKMWEKKVDGGGIVGLTTCLSAPHDVNTRCTWDEAMRDWIETVNAEGGTGYAGYNDWRVPTVGELQGILMARPPDVCPSPCIDPVFGPTATSVYWSSTTDPKDSSLAGLVLFGIGDVIFDDKSNDTRVRAVRGGP